MEIPKNSLLRGIAGGLLLYNIVSAEPPEFQRGDIHDAAAEGDLVKTKAIMLAYPHCINDSSSNLSFNEGMTPFQIAIMMGNEEIVEHMLQSKNINFFKCEPRYGDNALLTAIRFNGYVKIFNDITAYLEKMSQVSDEKSQECKKILAFSNREEETAFTLLIRLNVINKAAILQKFLELGIQVTTIPFETDSTYYPEQLQTNPLYALHWQKDWESFFILNQYYPQLLFSSIEHPDTDPNHKRFGNQSVIMKILKKANFPKFREAVQKYKPNNPLFYLLCENIPQISDENSALSWQNKLNKTVSSEGKTAAQILMDHTHSSTAIVFVKETGKEYLINLRE